MLGRIPFEVFTTHNGLSHDRIHDIKEDTDGNIVLLTYAGVDVFDGKVFKSYPKAFNNVLYNFEVDNEGKIWICDNDVECKLWVLENGIYEEIYASHNEDRKWVSFQYDKKNNLKFLTDKDSVYFVENDTLRFITTNKTGKPFDIGDLDDIPIFVSIKDSELFYFNNDFVPVLKTTYYSNFPILFEKLSTNKIWMYHKNVLELPGSNGERIRFENKFVNVNDVVNDKNNQYWLGTEMGLVQVYSGAIRSFSSKDLPNIWTIIEDRENNILFGSYDGELYKISPKTDEISLVKKGVNYFAGSAIDDEGRIYFAVSYGLEIKDGNNFNKIWDKTTFSVYYDKHKKKVIFGTFNGIGVFNNPDSIKYIGHEEGIHECGYIQNIGMDKEGYYWAGSYTGVTRLDPVTYRARSYTLENGKLNSKGIFCSFLDSSGFFWLGGDNGLMFYNYTKDSIIQIKSEVLNTQVKSIIDLDEDKLLIGTKEGLYIFDKQLFLNKNIVQLFFLNTSNGYTGIDPGFTGMYKDSKGYIWICSSTSVEKLDPGRIILKNQQPDILITGFNNNRIPFKHKNIIWKNKFNDANSIIKFEAIGFEHPLLTKYQYRLNKGKWSDWQNENQVVLKDLTKGDYIFEVRAGPVDNPPSAAKIDELMFNIDLPFYKSTWFLPFVVVFSGLLLSLSGFYFFRQRREHKLYLSQLEEAQYLRSQLLLSELNPHFIFNVLATIQNKVLFEKKELAADYVVKLSKLIRNFLTISHKANQLNPGQSEYEITLSKEIELLMDFIEFEKIKNNNYFDYQLIIDPEIIPDFIMIPPMLIQPFVENSIKHGLLLSEKNGNLWLTFKKENEDLIVLIEDDGVGMLKSKKIRSKNINAHTSLGSKIVKDRIDILNKLGYNISIEYSSKIPEGTIVKIILKEEL